MTGRLGDDVCIYTCIYITTQSSLKGEEIKRTWEPVLPSLESKQLKFQYIHSERAENYDYMESIYILTMLPGTQTLVLLPLVENK